MIARLYRFHGYGSLRGVYRHGQIVRGSSISLKFEKRDPKRPYRLAVVVSKKVHKSAVVRNRIRRRIYEIVRQYSPEKLHGLDLVFTIFSEEVAETQQDQLEKTINDLLGKAARQTNTPTPNKPEARGIVSAKVIR